MAVSMRDHQVTISYILKVIKSPVSVPVQS